MMKKIWSPGSSSLTCTCSFLWLQVSLFREGSWVFQYQQFFMVVQTSSLRTNYNLTVITYYMSIMQKQGDIVFNKIWTKTRLHPATRLMDMGDLSPESLHLQLSPRGKTAYKPLLITRIIIINQHSLHISISPQCPSFIHKPWPYPAVNLVLRIALFILNEISLMKIASGLEAFLLITEVVSFYCS